MCVKCLSMSVRVKDVHLLVREFYYVFNLQMILSMPNFSLHLLNFIIYTCLVKVTLIVSMIKLNLVQLFSLSDSSPETC